MTPSYSVPVNPPSPFPISGKPFPPIIVENFWPPLQLFVNMILKKRSHATFQLKVGGYYIGLYVKEYSLSLVNVKD